MGGLAMLQYCDYCNKITKGFKITINGEHDFMCLTCKNHSKFIPFIHPNRNEEYASIGLLDFEGSHNNTYGKG